MQDSQAGTTVANATLTRPDLHRVLLTACLIVSGQVLRRLVLFRCI